MDEFEDLCAMSSADAEQLRERIKELEGEKRKLIWHLRRLLKHGNEADELIARDCPDLVNCGCLDPWHVAMDRAERLLEEIEKGGGK